MIYQKEQHIHNIHKSGTNVKANKINKNNKPKEQHINKVPKEHYINKISKEHHRNEKQKVYFQKSSLLLDICIKTELTVTCT